MTACIVPAGRGKLGLHSRFIDFSLKELSDEAVFKTKAFQMFPAHTCLVKCSDFFNHTSLKPACETRVDTFSKDFFGGIEDENDGAVISLLLYLLFVVRGYSTEYGDNFESANEAKWVFGVDGLSSLRVLFFEEGKKFLRGFGAELSAQGGIGWYGGEQGVFDECLHPKVCPTTDDGLFATSSDIKKRDIGVVEKV